MEKTTTQKSKDKYIKEKTDNFICYLPKGTKEIVDKRAKELGKSRNQYIKDLIQADIGKPLTVETNGKTAEGSP